MVASTKEAWIGFNLVKGIGAVRLQALQDAFGDVDSAWQAAPAVLEAAGLGARLAEAVAAVRRSGEAARLWDYAQANQISVLTWEDPEYPRRLREIDGAPPTLYVRGQLRDEDRWAAAVVGTRRASAYGKQVAEEISASLARNGVTIVSGLARGVDALAHQAALRSGGRTIAVLGSGVDRIYPPEHRNLAEQIVASGAVISDYPPGSEPEAGNFPPRNRIISGLSQAIIVVEAGEKSGALITAAFAAEQGREVFAVPGSIYAPNSRGTNILIREGAHILLGAQDVLEILNVSQLGDQRAARQVLPGDATEAQLYALLGREPLHVDDLRARAGLPVEQVSAALTMMELKGLVRQVGGMHYVALFEQPASYETGPGDSLEV